MEPSSPAPLENSVPPPISTAERTQRVSFVQNSDVAAAAAANSSDSRDGAANGTTQGQPPSSSSPSARKSILGFGGGGGGGDTSASPEQQRASSARRGTSRRGQDTTKPFFVDLPASPADSQAPADGSANPRARDSQPANPSSRSLGIAAAAAPAVSPVTEEPRPLASDMYFNVYPTPEELELQLWWEPSQQSGDSDDSNRPSPRTSEVADPKAALRRGESTVAKGKANDSKNSGERGMSLDECQSLVEKLRQEVSLLQEEDNLLQDYLEGVLSSAATTSTSPQAMYLPGGVAVDQQSSSIGASNLAGSTGGFAPGSAEYRDGFALLRDMSEETVKPLRLDKLFSVSSKKGGSGGGGGGSDGSAGALDASESNTGSRGSVAPARRGSAYRRKSSQNRETLLTPEEKVTILRLTTQLARRAVQVDYQRHLHTHELLRAQNKEATMHVSEVRKDLLAFDRSVLLDFEQGHSASTTAAAATGGKSDKGRSVAAENVQKYFEQRPQQLNAIREKVQRQSQQLEHETNKVAARILKTKRQFTVQENNSPAATGGPNGFPNMQGENSLSAQGDPSFQTALALAAYYDYGNDTVKALLGPGSPYVKDNGLFSWKRIAEGGLLSVRRPGAAGGQQRGGDKGDGLEDSGSRSMNDALDNDVSGANDTGFESSDAAADENGEFNQVDLEQLRIENQQLAERIEKRNQELLVLKNTSARAVHTLNHLNDALNALVAERIQLKKGEKMRGEALLRVQRELVSVRREVGEARRHENTIRKKHEAVSVPSTEVYIAQRAELLDLENAVKNFKRKVEVGNGNVKVMQQHIKTLHATHRDAEHAQAKKESMYRERRQSYAARPSVAFTTSHITTVPRPPPATGTKASSNVVFAATAPSTVKSSQKNASVRSRDSQRLPPVNGAASATTTTSAAAAGGGKPRGGPSAAAANPNSSRT